MAADTCGAKLGSLVCDRAPHVDGDHRGYDEERDAVLFWPTPAAVLEDLERLIRRGLALVEPADRPDAGARLKATIDDAIGIGS